jgi:lipoprotein-anchoring transpeptidase ErfK/SrfK
VSTLRHATIALVAVLVAMNACRTVGRSPRQSGGEVALARAPVAVLAVRPAMTASGLTPADSVSIDPGSRRALAARRFPRLAGSSRQPIRLSVSLANRTLSLTQGADTVFQTPVALAEGLTLNYAGRRWRFQTPRGERTVKRKIRDPVWTPPDWHYAEAALRHRLRLDWLSMSGRPLSRGRQLVVRDRLVGIIEPGAGFLPLPTDEHIVFDRRLFVPPIGTLNRRIAKELGGFALDLGGGYLIHGGNDGLSIDQATTHGCIRIADAELAWLFESVPVGTVVQIH